jgi:hypothetical protein
MFLQQHLRQARDIAKTSNLFFGECETEDKNDWLYPGVSTFQQSQSNSIQKFRPNPNVDSNKLNLRRGDCLPIKCF